MNGDLLDTNAIIKYLAGDDSAKLLVDNASKPAVSVIVVSERILNEPINPLAA